MQKTQVLRNYDILHRLDACLFWFLAILTVWVWAQQYYYEFKTLLYSRNNHET